jgi:hypothetical protein
VPLSDVYYDDLSRSVSKASIPWYHVIDQALSDGRTAWGDGYGKAGTLGYLTREAAMVVSEAGHIEVRCFISSLNTTVRVTNVLY